MTIGGRTIFNPWRLTLALAAGLAVLVGCATATPPTPVSPVPPAATRPLTPTASMAVSPSAAPSLTVTGPASTLAAATFTPSPAPSATPGLIPAFSHVFVVVLENREFGSVVGNPAMPVYNRWAKQYTLLTNEYAVTHPSLPNYLTLIGGDTFHITSDCSDCYINAPSLPDQLEPAGLTWKTYQEDLPSPCFIGSRGNYAQKHDPFIYFDPIRLSPVRCQRSVLPLTQLTTDLSAGKLPNYAMIVPNMCNSGHDCGVDKVDAWLATWITPLIGLDPRSLIIITWDEGQGSHGCCEPSIDGGRVGTLLISGLVKPGFEDATPYTHYSLLKTIEASWNLPELGHAADAATALIVAPWKR